MHALGREVERDACPRNRGRIKKTRPPALGNRGMERDTLLETGDEERDAPLGNSSLRRELPFLNSFRTDIVEETHY
jgi:hypothetical protein